jgi:molecular chaperone GrpE
VRLAPRAVFLDAQRSFFSSKKEEEASKTAAEEEKTEVSEAEKALNERIAELEEKHAEVFDKYRRSLADFENLRNRMNKQVSDAKIFGIQGFCKDLLEVADVLNKAVTAVPSEALQESQYLKDMHQGLQLTESQLLKVAGKVHFRNIIK